MLKEFIGKDVIMIVSFSTSDSSPARLEGKVLDVEESLIKMNVTNYDYLVNPLSVSFLRNLTGTCIVNKNYIISIFEK